MSHPTIGFIGAGNMAGAIIQGLLKQSFQASAIMASNPTPQKLQHLSALHGIQTTRSNLDLVRFAEVIVLTVKPQVVSTVLKEIQAQLTHRQLIISVAAGVGCQTMARLMDEKQPIIRAMPNTPAMIGRSATALFANAQVERPARAIAESVFNACGITVWLQDEAQMDAVTAVSGSGPAYVFYFMEALLAAATRHGLPEAISLPLIQQTLLGSTELALQTGESLAALRARVTSPGGTTAAGIASLQAANFHEIIDHMVASAMTRARKLGQIK